MAGRRPGFYTRRTAQDWLARVLEQARAGTLPGMVRTDATVADAADEYLRVLGETRGWRPSTLCGYRSVLSKHILPAFGDWPLEDVTVDEVERWARGLADGRLSNRTQAKIITVFHGLMERARRVWRLPANPVAGVEKPRSAPGAGGIAVLTPAEVRRLVDAAADGQDAAIYMTAAFTGLRRGELIALRWADVDFEGACVRVTSNYVSGHLGSPKSGRPRTVPLAPAVARALARLHDGQAASDRSELVFPGTDGGYLDASALLRRYKAALRQAGLNQLRFHDLRHVFGTVMIRRVDIVHLQEWMGHADIQTTRQYLHYASRPDDARTVAEAFADGGDVLQPPSHAPEPGHHGPAVPSTPSRATHAPRHSRSGRPLRSACTTPRPKRPSDSRGTFAGGQWPQRAR